MRIPRVYVPKALASGSTISVTGQQARHIKQVLRLRNGDRLRLFNGDGKEYSATFLQAARAAITLQVDTPVDTLPEPGLHIRLVQGIARNERMDLILQKSVELGISEIQPLWMQRSQAHVRGERLEKRILHWQRVIASACEQCGRARLPKLFSPQPFADWIDSDASDTMRLMLQPDSHKVLAELERPTGTITLLVGPEGGMNVDERTLASAAGYIGIQLGARILRTETAALAALAGIQALWGDFR